MTDMATTTDKHRTTYMAATTTTTTTMQTTWTMIMNMMLMIDDVIIAMKLTISPEPVNLLAQLNVTNVICMVTRPSITQIRLLARCAPINLMIIIIKLSLI